MLLVKRVDGPSHVAAGEQATYRITAFNQDSPSPDQTQRVNWLVKAPTGAALTRVSRQGPVWSLDIPSSWAGQTITVMPYMNSPTVRVSVATDVAPLAAGLPSAGPVEVQIQNEHRRYYAAVNEEPRFFVGTDVRYGSRRGLMNSANPYGPRYSPQTYEGAHGPWAYYLMPTILCESKGAFNCINTYDRARFTLGHMQFAAHTPDANFVRLFRELLGLASAADYFPDLTLQDGRIYKRQGTARIQLENQDSTEALQDYLNPDTSRVGPGEVETAAKFMDWCARDPQFAATMAEFAFRDQKRKLRWHASKLPLDGLSDKLCLVVLDILHQGRAKYTAIKRALNQPDPFDALLTIGLGTYRERIASLRAGILDLEQEGIVGERAYNRDVNDFVIATEA